MHATQPTVVAIAYLLVASGGTKLLPPTVANTDEPDRELSSSTPACAIPLSAAELSVRTRNALLKGRITTMEQFCNLKLRDLKWFRNFGKKAVGEVIACRARLGVPVAA